MSAGTICGIGIGPLQLPLLPILDCRPEDTKRNAVGDYPNQLAIQVNRRDGVV